MGRILLTTCGVSLLQSSCWHYENLNHKCPKDEIELLNYQLYCKKILGTAMDYGDDIDFDDRYWKNLAYLRYMPAELASLRAIQKYFEITESPIGMDDKILLLYSSEKEGKFCGEIILKVLKNKKLFPKEVKINKWPIDGLNYQDLKKYEIALKKIWKESIEKTDNENIDFIFNLTGGYKGVVIMLGIVAYFQSNSIENKLIDIFYLHEDSKLDKDNVQISKMRFDRGRTVVEDIFTLATENLNEDHSFGKTSRGYQGSFD